MKKRILLLVLIAVVGTTIWMLTHRKNFLYAGTIEATDVDISPQLSAVISDVLVKEGESVQKGQTLVTLDGKDFRLAYEIAESDFKRGTKLRSSGSMPEEVFERLRFKRDDAKIRVDWLTITSPLDGVVLNRYREPGELVNPAMKLLTVANLSEVWAYVYVPQPMLAKLSLGMELTGYLPELNMKEVPGKIIQIRDQAEFTPKNVQTREERTRLVYGIKVAFANPEKILKPGMTVEVKLPNQ